MFFVFGSLFCWIFIPPSSVVHWFEFGKDWQEVEGRILDAGQTNAETNGQTVWSYFHSFELEGVRYTGKCFTDGPTFEGGQIVTIRYNANNPEESFIVGANRSIFPGFVAFVLIFPFVGLVFIIKSLISNWKAMRLLEIGNFTRGKLISKENTNASVTINGARYPVCKYGFEFETGGRKHTVACKTHQSWLVEDEDREIILFDCFNPEDSIVFDAYPNMPRISDEGYLKGPTVKNLMNLILPIIGIGMNVMFYLKNPFLVMF